MILPTLKQLQYLTALFDHGHFGKAADACFVTQSTLSAGLRELETLLDLTLVERTKRVVRFTPTGEKIALKAFVVLREASELAQLARAAGAPLCGDLHLGVIPTIAPFFLPHALPRLRASHPDLKLFLREEMSHIACDALMRGALDAVLLALPFPCGDVESISLFEDRVLAAFHRDEQPHGNEAVAPHVLDSERLMLLEDGHCFRGHALAACERPEMRSDRAVIGTSLHTLVQMVENKLGITLLPAMAVEAGILNHTHVVAKPLLGQHAYRTIALVWRRASPRQEEFRMLANLLRAGML